MRKSNQRVRRAALAGVLAAALSVPACGTIKFAYNNVDWLLLRKAEFYLDLDSGQRDRAEQFMKARMENHRRDELPLYVATFARIRDRLADGLEREEVEWIAGSVQSHYRRFVAGTIPGLTPLLASLDESQIDHLEARIQERNREYREKHLAPTLKVRLSNRTRRNVKIVEFWTGRLRDDQMALMESHGNAMPVSAEQWLGYRQDKQLLLLAMLRRGASLRELDDFLLGWWGDLAGLPQSLRDQIRVTRGQWTSLILDLYDSLSDEQRRHLMDKLDQIVVELGSLVPAGQRVSAGPGTRRPLELSGIAQ